MDNEIIDWLALILVFVGGLNWGLYGFMNMNLVEMLFGSMPILAQIVYALVALSAIYLLAMKVMKK